MLRKFIMLISMMLITVMMTITSLAAQDINIAIGDYIQLGTYYNKPILWRCVDIDENGPLMLSDKILCIKAFDASGANIDGSHKGGSYRETDGSNYWADSNIRSWLNSNEGKGKVKWLCGNPPDIAHVANGKNAYDQEAGFLTNFSEKELKTIKTVIQKSIVAYPEYNNKMYDYGTEAYKWESDIREAVSNYDKAYSENVKDSIFLLDVKQVSEVYRNSNILGADYYIGEPTMECVKWSASDQFLEANEKHHYWLRTPNTGIDANYYCSLPVLVSTGDISFIGYADSSDIGVRPAFYLNESSNIFYDGNGTIKKPYRVKTINLLFLLTLTIVITIILIMVICFLKTRKNSKN
ncbi:MAG: DUF6273 domain-containing protein [bacterium]|nr:DUF6273 domain-containing protein [bacterium]